MSDCEQLREEAAICRDLAREIKDPASIAMFLDRARQLEARALAIEAALRRRPSSPENVSAFSFNA
jgi:hypothetical protein